MRYAMLIAAAAAITGCTSLDVHPLPAEAKVDRICVHFNSEVNVDDFVEVVQEDLSDHHIQSVALSG